MASARLFHVDAFADELFAGNPAMVCLLPEGGEIDAQWMQQVATDVNLSETVFLRPLDDDPARDFEIRWFTPGREVDLCGHATLASGHILYELGAVERDRPIRLLSNSGLLTVADEQTGGLLWMDFPTTPAGSEPSPEMAEQIVAALGVAAPDFIGQNNQLDTLVAVAEPGIVSELDPDFRALKAIPNTRGFMVTAAAGGDPDFVSRYFAPACGVDEDPVTGSAHCALAPYWAGCLGRTQLVARQCSPRGGTVHCRVAGERTHLGGTAATLYEGTIDLPR